MKKSTSAGLILFIVILGNPLHALSLKKILQCRPGAKSNQGCTPEERKISKQWFIGGAVATAAITTGTALSLGAAIKKPDKNREKDIIGTFNKWYNLAQQEEHKKLKKEIEQNPSIWETIKANVSKIYLTPNQQDKLETIEKAINKQTEIP